MTRTRATLATIGCVLAVPLLIVVLAWMFVHPIIWRVLFWVFCVGGTTLLSVGLWYWFRHDDWRSAR